MLNKIKNLIFYAGLDKSEFNSLLPEIMEGNFNILLVHMVCGILIFALLTVFSACTKTTATKNLWLNFYGFLICLICYILTNLFKNNFSRVVKMIMVYIFMAILYFYTYLVVMSHLDKPAVTSIVLIVIIPLLFTDRPIAIIIITLLEDFLFSGFVICVKEPSIAGVDVINAFTFGLVSIVLGTFMMTIKVRSLQQTVKIRYLSQTDILTGCKNRNFYEEYVENLKNSNKASGQYTCIYLDVNGLHEYNNSHGHKAGDQMLKFVAGQMIEHFGENQTFRLGGDEFLSIIFNEEYDNMNQILQDIVNKCQNEGYTISVGMAESSNFEFIENVVQEAETEMYQAKRNFYSMLENDRRRR